MSLTYCVQKVFYRAVCGLCEGINNEQRDISTGNIHVCKNNILSQIIWLTVVKSGTADFIGGF